MQGTDPYKPVWKNVWLTRPEAFSCHVAWLGMVVLRIVDEADAGQRCAACV